MGAMTPEAKAKLSKTIRALRERLLADLADALRGEYNLAISDIARAKLSDARAKRRERLEGWVDEQVRALPPPKSKSKKEREAAEAAAVARFRNEVVEQAAYTWLNRLVYLRLLEGMKLRRTELLTGGLASKMYSDFRDLAQALVGHDDGDDSDGYMFVLGLVFDELALDLPGLFDRSGLSELVPMRWSTLRHVIEALDNPELASCWTDDMTLGWVYQYWNDPKREELDEMVTGGGKIAPHEIASKTQMFTERYMVDWLLQNSLGALWLAICQKHGWVAQAVAEGTLARLEARRADWRAKRDAGEVDPTALMPLHSDSEHRWIYYLERTIPAETIEAAPESIRDLRLIDPAVGSGHFLVVAVDLLVALYKEEAKHRNKIDHPKWSDQAIIESILMNNLHGIDIDPRAVQIAAAALMLKAKRVCPQVQPGRLNLVASKLRLGSLPDDDPALIGLREQVKLDTGISGHVTDTLVRRLAGADHLGSLLKIGDALDEVLKSDGEEITRVKAEQGSLFGSGFSQVLRRDPVSLDEAKASLQRRLEEFLAKHTSSADLGLRLRGEQLAAGVRFVRMLEGNSYHLVIGNPPYQGTGKLQESSYVLSHYPDGKADLFAAFFLRAMELACPFGLCAFITLSNWMFLRTYSSFRRTILKQQLVAIADLGKAAFSTGGTLISTACTIIARSAMARTTTALRPHSAEEVVRDQWQPARTNSALMIQRGRYDFDPTALKVVPEWPLVYWWNNDMLHSYATTPKLGDIAQVRQGMATGHNVRFLRCWWEVALRSIMASRVSEQVSGFQASRWVPYIKGANGREWQAPLHEILRWSPNALQVKTMERDGEQTSRPQNEDFYFMPGIAFSSTGTRFQARAHRYRSVFDVKGQSVFPTNVPEVLAAMNSAQSRAILESLNPSISFQVGDALRLPVRHDPLAVQIFSRICIDFTLHESHREPSIEFKHPGPSPWRHTQEWAQLAVDRPENSPLRPYEEQLDPEPPTDHISFALGVVLGRFSPTSEGILDPQTANLSHALPHGILLLDGTQPADATTDGLGHTACAQLHAAWSDYSPNINTRRKHLRDYLRLDFFAVHCSTYENRPIHWPLSSAKKTFVAWINIHRWHGGTLRYLLAEYLNPIKLRLDGELADLRKARDGADKKAARTAEKRLEHVTAWRDELADFIANISTCSEKGPPQPDPKTPARTDDAVYDPDLDDGVMINSAALWPLLTPQWKEPKKWWKELATAEGRKDHDWSQLAARYFKTRVDQKCQKEPSLAVAHGCFWKYHPGRAYAWELQLQDEIAPDFTIDEAESDKARARFLKDHRETAQAIHAKELARRTRKLEKADAEAQAELEDVDEGDDDD
jgi:hypothetical protein